MDYPATCTRPSRSRRRLRIAPSPIHAYWGDPHYLVRATAELHLSPAPAGRREIAARVGSRSRMRWEIFSPPLRTRRICLFLASNPPPPAPDPVESDVKFNLRLSLPVTIILLGRRITAEAKFGDVGMNFLKLLVVGEIQDLIEQHVRCLRMQQIWTLRDTRDVKKQGRATSLLFETSRCVRSPRFVMKSGISEILQQANPSIESESQHHKLVACQTKFAEL